MMAALSTRTVRVAAAAQHRNMLLLCRRTVLAPPRAAYSTGHFTEYTLSTEDKLEIMDLCHKFDRLLNTGHQEKLGELFAPDAQVITPMGTVKGVAPILDYFQSCKPLAAGNRHLTCNILVQPDGVRSAKVSAYRLLHKCCCPPVLLASGTIEDKLLSIEGEWRFSQRVFKMDPPAQQPPAQSQAAAGASSSSGSSSNGKH